MNRKGRILLAVVAAGMICILPPSAPAESEFQALMEFLVGAYDLIGRQPDSDELYSGTVTIARQGDRLLVERVINGKTVVGPAAAAG